MELAVFLVAGAACIAGALGVVLNSNPVHAALSLVGTLFGIAVLFIAQEANFLAAVQVIVYAGAIVVLFLFVLMLLGVAMVVEGEHRADVPFPRPRELTRVRSDPAFADLFAGIWELLREEVRRSRAARDGASS